jgi:hypothetical protein
VDLDEYARLSKLTFRTLGQKEASITETAARATTRARDFHRSLKAALGQ